MCGKREACRAESSVERDAKASLSPAWGMVMGRSMGGRIGLGSCCTLPLATNENSGLAGLSGQRETVSRPSARGPMGAFMPV